MIQHIHDFLQSFTSFFLSDCATLVDLLDVEGDLGTLLSCFLSDGSCIVDEDDLGVLCTVIDSAGGDLS